MSNTTSRRASPAQFAFFLAFFSLLCFGMVASHLLPFEPGWSARVSNMVLDVAFSGVILLMGAAGLGLIAAINREIRLALRTLTLFGRPPIDEAAVPKQLKVLSALDVVSMAVAIVLMAMTFLVSVDGTKAMVLTIFGDDAPVAAAGTVLGALSVTALALNYVINVQLRAQRRAFFDALLRANP